MWTQPTPTKLVSLFLILDMVNNKNVAENLLLIGIARFLKTVTEVDVSKSLHLCTLNPQQ